MGAILAKFRKEKTTTVVLEGLEEKIQKLERYTLNTQEQKKRFVGNFLAVSIGVYAIAFIAFYFVYFPPTRRERIIYSVPLLLFPLVIILLRRLFTWYFQRILNKNSNKLAALRAEKRKILEQVMDKETYKVAVNLLARFGDKNNGQKSLYAMTPRVSSSSNISGTPRSIMSQSVNTLATSTSGSPLNTTVRSTLGNTSLGAMPGRETQRLFQSYRSPQQAGNTQSLVPRSLALTPHHRPGSGQELRLRTPFPIVNQQNKGVLERIVDVLIGDGPQDRFAMICKECYAHNGMALKEDFEYTTFRCAFCNALNPSRKARPIAPRLPEHQRAIAAKHSSDSSSSTDIDSEDDKESSALTQVPPTPVRIALTEKSTKTNVPVNNEVGAGDNTDVGTNSDAESENAKTTMQTAEETFQPQPQNEEEQPGSVDEMSRLQECFNKMYGTLEQTNALQAESGEGNSEEEEEGKKTK